MKFVEQTGKVDTQAGVDTEVLWTEFLLIQETTILALKAF